VEGLRKISSFVAERIARRRASGRLGNDILGLLLSAVDAEDGKGMSDAQAHSEAMTLFFAAHHTNAACLAWTLYLLSQHPDIEQRAVAEIAERASRLPLTPHGVALPYVEQILQESLRLYPPAWSLFTRESIADVELGGYRIPARSWFFIYPWVLHHDERFFPNPWKFDPDRFAESRAETIPNGAYIPFGLGGHACAGTKMALNFLNSVLPAILKRFSFALAAEQGPVIPEPLLSLRPRNDIRMVVRRRSPLPVVSPVQAHAVS
jgi:cytochrome P450